MNSDVSYVQKEYIVPKDKFSEYLLLACSIIIILGLWILILFKSRDYNDYIVGASGSSSASSAAKSTPGSLGATSNDQVTIIYEKCPIGECPTNIQTGEKRCPINSNINMLYDPTIEVCNPADACTSNFTPYAVLFDQSTDANGICDFSTCRCIKNLSTASFAEVLFQVSGGNIYESNPQLFNTWYFSQVPTSASGQGNNVPIKYSDPTAQFWKISPSLLANLTPLTIECRNAFALGPEASAADTLSCVNSNPCVVGKMAYVQGYGQYVTSFDYFKDINSTSVACVPAIVDNPRAVPGSANPIDYISCADGTVPVFNYINGKIFCVSPF